MYGNEPQFLTFIWKWVNKLVFQHSHIKLFLEQNFSRMRIF